MLMKKCKESNLYIDKTVILIIEVRHVIIKKKKKRTISWRKRGDQRFKGAVSFN